MNHLAGDGYSYFYFLSALAGLSKNRDFTTGKYADGSRDEPSHDRTILKEFRFNETKNELLQDNDDFIIEIVEVNKATVRNMIKNVAFECKQAVSGNDILSAMVTKKMAEKQKKYFGESFQLTMPMDVRIKIKEFGRKYFGNGLMFNTINFKSTDILTSGVHEIAVRIRKSMPDVTKASYLDYLSNIEELIATRQINRLTPYDPEKGCLVTNLSLLPLNKLDFGTGEPDFIFLLTIEKNSIGILSAKDSFILRMAY
jgi:hypothetical protein